MSKGWLAPLGLASLLWFTWPGECAAWQNHDLLMQIILAQEHWLTGYQQLSVEVIPASDRSVYNARYLPVYLDHLPGEKQDALEILERYADEPEWGMDTELELSPFQPVMGGSKGYRHQYYYFAVGIVRIGAAPERVSHFYRLAVTAAREGNWYWAFRQLARSLHYLADMGQPLNTRSFLYSWLWQTRFVPNSLTKLAKNYQLAYEVFADQHLQAERSTREGPLLAALRHPPKLPFEDPQTAARALAEYNSKRAPALLKMLEQFLPRRIKSPKKMIIPAVPEIRPLHPPVVYHEIMDSTSRSLELTAGAIHAVLALAQRDFAKLRKKVTSEE
ncbi:MAG: hypothetical protein HY692_05850 [Cyanobacteria bacterium NC_groundwater_1444_Ag_S-0.65um_54_12]|nr:hypothetical protein [Cyanobacteria bacterium NC_groundwater_1444_Ag_S-0.65um_54_12]